jgi:hypothetical protein
MKLAQSGAGSFAPFVQGTTLINGKVSATASAGALTIALKTVAGDDPSNESSVYCSFRTSNGSYVAREIVASNTLILSNGSTLGLSNGVAARLYVLGIDDGATFRLGAVYCSQTGNFLKLDELTAINAQAEGGVGGADSASNIYSTAIVTSKYYRILGYLDWNSGLVTAGVWTAPDVIELARPGTKKPGDEVYSFEINDGAVQTGTTVMILDDTIPQSTGEGDQYYTFDVSPTSPANFADIEILLNCAHSVAGGLIVSLFQDSGVNALVSDWEYCPGSADPVQLSLRYIGRVGVAGITTFKVRAGGINAGTFTLNGSGGTRKLGGSMGTYLRYKEVAG